MKKQKKHTNWFWWEKERYANGFKIYTQGLGDTPARTLWYATDKQMQKAIKEFEKDGYKNMGEM
jgi:hypothetical protein